MPQPRLLDQVRSAIRLRHYSIRTEEAYLNVIRRFILYHHKRHPKEMGVDEIRQYLSHLATDEHVAASTQNVALAALLFLYRQVLQIDLPLIEGVERAKRPKRIPVVLTSEEVQRVLTRVSGTHYLVPMSPTMRNSPIALINRTSSFVASFARFSEVSISAHFLPSA